ncbi:receptor-type tyrosine-protein phosphatase beta [Elysia marginata]|uniref:Receptor-type tyrosine-protein phosphatase beta n=1 Tax=Elysia marginata TaxID=1093978 RepID=A0AAV4ERT9_9GAST|nr:receptor-type tyrosine-protein phosphatase beta [Elysia marginata]
MATTQLLFFCLFVNSVQMSLFHNVFPASEEKDPPSSSARSEGASRLVQSGPPKDLQEPALHVFSFDISENDSAKDGELYGVEVEDYDLMDFDIVLGQRIDFQKIAGSKSEIRKGHGSKSARFKNTNKELSARAKRSILASDKSDKQTLTSTAHPLSAEIVFLHDDKNATRTGFDSLLDNTTVFESSGDGEFFNETNVGFTNSTLSPQFTENYPINNNTRDDQNFTAMVEDDEYFETVTCESGAEGQACWEPSVGEFDTDEAENEEKAKQEQENSSSVDNGDTGAGDAGESGNRQPGDSGRGESTESTRQVKEVNTTESNLHQMKTPEMIELSKNSTTPEPKEETPTISQEQRVTFSNVKTHFSTSSSENKDEKTTFSTITKEETNAYNEGSTKFTTEPVEDQIVTSLTGALDIQTTEKPSDSEGKIKASVNTNATIAPTNSITTTTEKEPTRQSDRYKTEATGQTAEIMDSSTLLETTSKRTDSSTTSKVTIKTTEAADEVSTSTTVMTPINTETTTQTTVVTLPAIPTPVLNGTCSLIDQQGDTPTQLQRCREVSGADCVDGICQCQPEWYQLGDSCKKRRFDNNLQLELSSENKTSIRVSWPDLPASQTLVGYKVRWKELTGSADTRTKSARSVRLVRSVSGNQAAQNPHFDDENVLSTNDTTAVIEKLIPGSEYLVEVIAVVVIGDGRREELWYPQRSFRLDPSCLMWSEEKVTLIPMNRTMIIAFQPLQGTFNKCYINIKAQNLEGEGFTEVGCQKFALTHFEFGMEYTVKTKVTSGESEETSCTSTKKLFKESKLPDEVCKFDVTKTTSETFTVQWEPPCIYHGYLVGYEVTLKSAGICNVFKFVNKLKTSTMQEIDKGHGGDDNADAKNNYEVAAKNENNCKDPSEIIYGPMFGQQTLTITGLSVVTSYQVKIAVLNENGRGQETLQSTTTLSRLPEPPTGFQGVAIGLSKVDLTWIPPKPYPGPTHYVVYVFQFLKGNMPPQFSGFVLAETIKGYTSNSILIDKLITATSYQFYISAITARGESRNATTGVIQTWEIQSPQVVNLKVTSKTSDTVSVTWGMPRQGKGRTRAYVVIVKSTKNACIQALAIVNDRTYEGPSQTGVPTLDQTLSQACTSQRSEKYSMGNGQLDTAMTIKNLQPNTEYVIQVAAYNGAGLGQPNETEAKTTNAVPNAPTQFSCSEQSKLGEIYLGWKKPEPKPGDTTYILTIEMADDYDGKTFSVFKTENIKDYFHDHHYMKNLRDYWLYKASLTASTPAGRSQTVHTQVCRTMPAVPGKVSRLSVNQHNITQLEIKWECPEPEDRHGILEYFLLQIIATKTTRKDIKPDELSNQPMKITARKDHNGSPDCSLPYVSTVQILPQVTYEVLIRVKVQSVRGIGTPYTRTIYSPGEAPPALPKPDRIITANEKPQPFTFKTMICPPCLVNSVAGEIVRYGLGVCQTGFCYADSRRNHTLRDYDKLGTWKTSKHAQFKIPYKISDASWKKMIVSESLANHASVQFVVGSQASCKAAPDNSYCNGPLPPGKEFRVFQFACTTDGCSESDLSEAAVTPAAVTRLLSSEPVQTSTSDAIVIGGAASGVAVALIIILVIVIVRMRLRKVVEISDKEKPGEDMQLSEIISSHDAAPGKSRPIKLKDFEETLQQLHANNNDLFSQEFTELDMDSTVHPMTVGSDPQYRKQNRWSNILPYDHTRVKLKVVDGDEKCSDDYINANFLVRSGVLREKVAQYYPDEAANEGSRYNHLVVSWRGKLDNQAWEVRTFHLTHRLERRSRYVKHFFFKSWTDHKADISPQDLISFVNTVREESESHPPAPIVVHCSAGVGRTGTFVAVDYFCRYIKDLTKGSRLSKISDVMGSLRGSWAKRKSMMWEDNTVDIYGRIIALRDCRRYMVQTKSQYAFVYDAVMQLIRQASRLDDTSESGGDTESCLSELTPAAGTSASNDAVYDDVDVLKR